MAKEYAVIRRWKDNPDNFQVIDYYNSKNECLEYISNQEKSNKYNYEVAKYD